MSTSCCTSIDPKSPLWAAIISADDPFIVLALLTAPEAKRSFLPTHKDCLVSTNATYRQSTQNCSRLWLNVYLKWFPVNHLTSIIWVWPLQVASISGVKPLLFDALAAAPDANNTFTQDHSKYLVRAMAIWNIGTVHDWDTTRYTPIFLPPIFTIATVVYWDNKSQSR